MMFADKLIKQLSKKKNALMNDHYFPVFDIPTWDSAGVEDNVEFSILDLLTRSFSPATNLWGTSSPVRCQFFDFGEFNLRAGGKNFSEEYIAARTAYQEGFLGLPSQICFFQAKFLVDEDRDEPSDLDKAIAKQTGTKRIIKSGMKKEWFDMGFLIFQPDINTPENLRLKGLPTLEQGNEGWFAADGSICLTPIAEDVDDDGIHTGSFYSKPFIYFRRGAEIIQINQVPFDQRGPAWGSMSKQEYVDHAEIVLSLLLPMLGRLNVEGVQKTVIEPPAKVNRLRRLRNQPNLVVHTTVKIAPWRAPLGHSGPQEGNEFTPPRYHFRRGHVRRFRNGEKTWVRSCFVGDPTSGAVEHDYVVT